ncbi:MAG: M50 family metallopeptidase [Gemmatimonadota bacterium]|jgi:hypothetical protein
MSKSTSKIEFIAGYTLFFVALWLLWGTPLVYPVKIFVVLLHEISHAAIAVATGGHIDRIELSPLEGGACYCPGGNAFLTASAGYLGSSAWGGLMFMAARARRIRADWVTGFIGVLVVALSVLYVRTAFGLVFGVLFGLAMLGVARKATRSLNRTLLFGLGLTSVLYAILDIKSDILDRPGVESDAYILSQLTGVPTVVWGIAWISLALAFSFWLLRGAYREA